MLLVKSRELKSLGKNLIKTMASVLGVIACPTIANTDSSSSYSSYSAIASIFLSLLVVVGLIFAVAYVMRRFNVTSVNGGQMKVVASMMAGVKEKVMVIEVAGEQHLIGVTGQQITHLSKLTNPIDTSDDKNNASGGSFQQKLAQAMAEKINPNIKGQRDE